MAWHDLAALVHRKVPPGSVTTYADLASKLFRDPNVPKNHPVTSMLKKWEAEEPETHAAYRVVRDDGTLAMPDQERRLRAEGVPFLDDGVVDVAACKAVL